MQLLSLSLSYTTLHPPEQRGKRDPRPRHPSLAALQDNRRLEDPAAVALSPETEGAGHREGNLPKVKTTTSFTTTVEFLPNYNADKAGVKPRLISAHWSPWQHPLQQVYLTGHPQSQFLL